MAGISVNAISVTLGFFDDILITPECLQYPSKFDEREQIWIWEYKGEEENETHEMYMDKGERIKFRVTGEMFNDTTPLPDSNAACGNKSDPQSNNSQPGTSKAAPAASQQPGSTSDSSGAPQKIPYSLTVCNILFSIYLNVLMVYIVYTYINIFMTNEQ